MTATALREATTVLSDGAHRPWVGTGALFRLFLRLDRVRITVWALAVYGTVAGSIATLLETYPTPESLQARAALMSNPSAVMMTGPAFGLENYTFGAMVANELSLWTLLAAAIMSVLLVVRHTRAEEESGRLEVVRALPVGRFAPPTAAVATVAVANVAVGVAVTAGLLSGGADLAAADSVAFGLATALTGLVFAAVAAITAQLTEHGRAASGMALAVMGATFLARGVGDVIDPLGSPLSWTSPFAWAQQTRLFVDLRWWPLAVSAVAAVALGALAVALAQRRDLGAGLRPSRPGPASAAPTLLTPAGLALRLLRGQFWGWAVGSALFALAFGALANSLGDFAEELPDLGGLFQIDITDLTNAFASVVLAFMLVGVGCFVVAAVLRLRAEEAQGRVAAVVVTGTSRPRLLAGWLAVVAAEAVAMALLVGLGAGVGVWSGSGDPAWVGRLVLASLVYLPAIALLAALAVALVGVAPRAAVWAWLPVGWGAFVLFLGGLVDVPEWSRALSPFDHTPLVPQESVAAGPLAAMAALAAVLVAVGFAGLARRDLER